MSMKMATEVLGRFNLHEALISPHLVTREYALQLFHTLKESDDSLEHEACKRNGPNNVRMAYGFNGNNPPDKPFAFQEGLAIIPVWGTLLNRFSSSWGSVTGYNFIRNQMQAALADPDVKGIVFDLNSNGGEAAGCFELCADILASRAEKPSMAIIDSAAYSAGYAIASSATKVVAAPSAGAGSVGVVVMHASVQGLLEKNGINISFIHAGAHKVDGNMFQDLPADVAKRIQGNVNKSYDKFVSVVAENRGMDAQAVRDTEALTYNADDALKLGLIDEIATPQAAISAFITELSGSTTQKGISMTTTEKPGDGKAALTAEDIAKAQAEAKSAERARMSAITSCEEAKGKSKLASHLAMNTDLSVEDAKAILTASAPEVTSEAPAGDTGFRAAMDRDGGAGVTANTGAKTTEEAAAKPSNRILAAQAKAHGKKLDA
jgi:signal peptide peptidase SppA